LALDTRRWSKFGKRFRFEGYYLLVEALLELNSWLVDVHLLLLSLGHLYLDRTLLTSTFEVSFEDVEIRLVIMAFDRTVWHNDSFVIFQ
jgi:hypothetical protein